MAGYRIPGSLDGTQAKGGRIRNSDGSNLPSASYSNPGPVSEGELTPQQKELLLDLGQLVLDIVGFFEPTPFADGTNSLISLGRGDWLGAGISLLGVIPYFGDLAKAGKLPRYAKSLSKALTMAKHDVNFARRLRPLIQKLATVLEKIPLSGVPSQLADQLKHIKSRVREFLRHSHGSTVSKGAKVIDANIQKFEKRLSDWLSGRVAPKPISGKIEPNDYANRIRESKTYAQGRDLLTKLKNKPPLVGKRIACAGEFFADHGFAIDDIVQLLRGIDFSKDVVIRNIKGSTEVFTQRIKQGRDPGNWFSKSGFSFHDIGIAKGNREYKLFKVNSSVNHEIQVLESYATPVMDFWTTRGKTLPTGGGGLQIVIPNPLQVLEEL